MKKTYTQIEYEDGDNRYWLDTDPHNTDLVWIQTNDSANYCEIGDGSHAINVPVHILQEMARDLLSKNLNRPVEKEIPF